ncbi:unnamed protein product [Dovyalis caffra]|uniref:Dehydrin n=1 Tax=Dovyalis caffra TaxID=77055 RepID=A0AAV1RSM1_9ROSI|nr:unnamed protein product [Dovyalis caffra]
MASYQNISDDVRKTADEYGNPVGQRDEYGNPTGQRTGTTDGGYGSAGVGYGTATTGAGQYGGAPVSAGTGIGTGGEYNKEQQGKLHRSGSAGSSSSEDDGQGGRRKKGIKEKLTGTGYENDPSNVTSTAPGGYSSAEQTHEKKGIIDKIKEKLPGSHGDEQKCKDTCHVYVQETVLNPGVQCLQSSLRDELRVPEFQE